MRDLMTIESILPKRHLHSFTICQKKTPPLRRSNSISSSESTSNIPNRLKFVAIEGKLPQRSVCVATGREEGSVLIQWLFLSYTIRSLGTEYSCHSRTVRENHRDGGLSSLTFSCWQCYCRGGWGEWIMPPRGEVRKVSGSTVKSIVSDRIWNHCHDAKWSPRVAWEREHNGSPLPCFHMSRNFFMYLLTRSLTFSKWEMKKMTSVTHSSHNELNYYTFKNGEYQQWLGVIESAIDMRIMKER